MNPSLASRRVTLTGATGHLGRALAHALLRDGVAVRCLVRDGSARLPDGAQRAIGDVDPAQPAGDLEAALDGADLVVHAAALTRRSRAGRTDLLRVNGGGTQRLVDAASRAAPSARLLLISSFAAVGPSPAGEPLTPEHPCRPASAYGISKLAAEQAVGAAPAPWTIVRLPGLYGPGDRSLLPAFRAVRWGFRPAGSRRLPLMHERDAVAAILHAATHPDAANRVLHAAGPAVTATECGRAIAAALRRRALPVPLFGPWLRFIDPDRARELAGDWPIDAGSLERLGWRAQAAFGDGMRELGEWYRREGLIGRW